MTATLAPPTYSSAQVCHVTGITERQLNHWVYRRWLRPSFATRHSEPKPRQDGGSGYDRCFDAAELDRARMMARLVELGVTAQQAAKVARDPTKALLWLTEVAAAVSP